MGRNEDLCQAIKQSNVEAIVRLMFEDNPPMVRTGFRTETELWDFKVDCPKLGKEKANAWADLAYSVLAFHNQNGGVLIFGIRNDFSFSGATERLDSKLVNDQLRKFLGDRIWVEFHREFIQANQRYLGIILIPPRGPILERFRTDAPEVNGSRIFRKGESAVRIGDSNQLLTHEEANELSRKTNVPQIKQVYLVNEPFFRILSPEYTHFVERLEPCKKIEEALCDPRSTVTSVIGIGGVGKTALATWAAIRAYERRNFDFIVSIAAKDRELTSSGIQAIEPGLTSFETLLDNTLEVLGFPEVKGEPTDTKENKVRDLLKGTNGLLYVDNLETVDDPRIVAFLDTLPVGVRALVTSRRTSVRVSVHPVDLGPLTEEEVIQFIGTLEGENKFSYVSKLSKAERARIGVSCDNIPLAIKWALSRSTSATEALALADSFKSSGRYGEEILEFCFRRVFETMPEPERSVLQVLSLFRRPVPVEVLLVGTTLPDYKIQDSVEILVSDAIVQRLFDPDCNDYSYKLLPITRAFVHAELTKHPELENRIRRSLTVWFEASDIKDPEQRLVIRDIRQGRRAPESALLDLAYAAERNGDLTGAQRLYEQALTRNPKSWKAARLCAEFYRHKLRNTDRALRFYEQAAANSPRRGQEKALIFREWGILLTDSGMPDATNLAIEKLEIALTETPNDEIAIHALAHMLKRKGAYRRVIELLEPLRQHRSFRTREKTLPLLLEAYECADEPIKVAEIRDQLKELEYKKYY